jgi:hypothetical protein
MSFASMLGGLRARDIRFVVIGGIASAAHGSGRHTDDLDICYDVTEENIARLSTLLAEWDAYPRGVERGLPFIMDARQFHTQPIMTLTTREGDLDVLDRVAGVGDYAAVRARSLVMAAFDVEFDTIDLPALIDAKRAANRKRDREHLPELEALLALREGGKIPVDD